MSTNIVYFPVAKQHSQVTVKHDQSHLRSIASGLMLIVQIPADRSLTSILGHGNEKSNHEAIMNWIQCRWNPGELQSLSRPLDTTSQLLAQYLNDQIKIY